jgi:hypothetical protein
VIGAMTQADRAVPVDTAKPTAPVRGLAVDAAFIEARSLLL